MMKKDNYYQLLHGFRTDAKAEKAEQTEAEQTKAKTKAKAKKKKKS